MNTRLVPFVKIRLTSLICSVWLVATSVAQQPLPPRGMERVTPPDIAPETYTNCWAVIVGINYSDSKLVDGDRKVVPALRNAENDAKAVKELLVNHYGYKEEHIRTLIGKDATRKTIEEAIGDTFLRDKTKVTENDSVLFFFAGHGIHIEKRNAELLPWDVQVTANCPKIETCIELQKIVDWLKDSPARHKLIILDSCYSGAIFNRPAIPSYLQSMRIGSQTLRYEAGIFHEKAVQAISSGLSFQQVSDGGGGHSPFTAALKDALMRIPRHQGKKVPIRAWDLFISIQSDLKSKLSVDQSAAFGWLTTEQGEFHFFPDPKSDFSRYSNHTDDEMLKVIAMAPSTHGAWWFDEMPWFIPCLRSRILMKIEKSRSTTSGWVEKNQLEKSAHEVLRVLENEIGELEKLRLRHLKLLLDPVTRQDLDTYETIVKELREPPKGVTLEATDLHLLAVIEHRLGQKARESYNKAIRAYADGSKSGRKQDAVLRLLCLADLGYYEFLEKEYEQAALIYQQAIEERVLCPIPFQIFVLCSEADAWQRLGRWGEADYKLDQALNLSNQSYDESKREKNPLTAYAYTRRAWAYMEQWKFFEAAKAFENANEHLYLDEDPKAEIIRFHNRHGLAMAQRFSGDPEGALAEYRKIYTDIRNFIIKLHRDIKSNKNFPDIQERLYVRLVNTLERQADCNLFREKGDLREASDDLRRALRVTDFLPILIRNSTRAVLLYKQVIALSIDSPFQDLELAAGYLREAELLSKSLSEKQKNNLECYQKIANAICKMAKAFHSSRPDELRGAHSPQERRFIATADLRTTIAELRPRLNQPIHRDDLELLLFASQYLLTVELECADRHQLLTDAELLLQLCRYAMRNEPLETQRYLRHYFDSVIRAMIAARPKNVQGILEAVYEARVGQHYNKPDQRFPCLVIYLLNGRFYAFLDAPQGLSKIYSFDEDVSIEVVRQAHHSKKLIPLPKQLREDLLGLKLDQYYFPESLEQTVEVNSSCLQIQWHDGYYLLGKTSPKPIVASEYTRRTNGVVTAHKSPNGNKLSSEQQLVENFPFSLQCLQKLDLRLPPPPPIVMQKVEE